MFSLLIKIERVCFTVSLICCYTLKEFASLVASNKIEINCRSSVIDPLDYKSLLLYLEAFRYDLYFIAHELKLLSSTDLVCHRSSFPYADISVCD